MPRRPNSTPFSLPDDLPTDAPSPPRRNASRPTNRIADPPPTGNLRQRLTGTHEATRDTRTPFDSALEPEPLALLDVPTPRRRATTRTASPAPTSQKKLPLTAPSRRAPMSGDRKREIAGVLLVAVACVLLVNMLRGEGDSLFASQVVGALRWLTGAGALAVPVALGIWGVLLIARRDELKAFAQGTLPAFAVALAWVHLNAPRENTFAVGELTTRGGIVGAGLSLLLRSIVGDIGARIALGAVSLVCLLLWTQLSLGHALSRLGASVSDGAHRLLAKRAHRAQRREREQNDAVQASPIVQPPTPRVLARPRRLRHPVAPVETQDETDAPEPDAPSQPALELADDEPQTPANPERQRRADPQTPAAPRIEIASVELPPSILSDDEPLSPAELLERQAQATASPPTTHHTPPTKPCRAFGDAVMPPYFDEALRGMDAPLPLDVSGVEDDIQEGVTAVQDTLAAFRVDARVTDVKRGPVITRYEVQPAPGVRVAAIANLDRDLARSLSALAVRIEAPVPGKNVVGIEVPNKRVHLVRMRDVLELPDFLSAPSKLSFVLGRDIAGQPKWADLTKMPHLLIAGATNSGKSVCLNSIIASILLRASPDEVKFSLIDPKRVELTLFRDIKHLYHPVVVEPKDAVRALKGAIAEMDRRYRKFSARGCRNIASYNQKLDPDEKPLPYLVIVIDELADLMMTAAAEFEKLICRLAQLARATGIHLIVATQRPSVNVITGVIKANIPARIAFAVASQVDSRTILDAVGAERLIGSGDMLFDANNGGKALRIQGAYLSEEEVNRVVESVKACYRDDPMPLDYGMDLALVADDDAIGGGTNRDELEEKRDELYDEIRAFVVRHQEMSASNIQRKFEIGYPRAGRIVDQLERDGVLGPADGPKARKVLVSG